MSPLALSDDERDSFALGRLRYRIRRARNHVSNERERPENQDCGLHPMDIFLARLFDEIERKQSETLLSPNQPTAAKDSYGRLLYAFTLLHMTSPRAYQQLSNAMTLWDMCKSKGQQTGGSKPEAALSWLFNEPVKPARPSY
ncbi:unnamed protein product [Echinostoma caproni]|uniref:Rab-GAP TBC domain-containing protein n=1 Tax=Echinostoma caproni TaxID=27848 RepID=A0A183ABL2_9TREM|nr:unnamed protein product [Echinostoma caproni]